MYTNVNLCAYECADSCQPGHAVQWSAVLSGPKQMASNHVGAQNQNVERPLEVRVRRSERPPPPAPCPPCASKLHLVKLCAFTQCSHQCRCTNPTRDMSRVSVGFRVRCHVTCHKIIHGESILEDSPQGNAGTPFAAALRVSVPALSTRLWLCLVRTPMRTSAARHTPIVCSSKSQEAGGASRLLRCLMSIRCAIVGEYVL